MAVRNLAHASAPAYAVPSETTETTRTARVVIAFICTANRCRSPLAEHLMRIDAAKRGLSLEVFSMGLLQSGFPAPERGVAVAAEFGLDLRHHRSTAVRLDRLASADLVLGMSRSHVREVVSALPSLWPRAFTLKQFARFATGRPKPRRAQLSSWLQAEAEERSRGEMLGHSAQDDIQDPLRASAAVWRDVIGEISANVVQVLDTCTPLLRPTEAAQPFRR